MQSSKLVIILALAFFQHIATHSFTLSIHRALSKKLPQSIIFNNIQLTY